jgi:hypothetical protein
MSSVNPYAAPKAALADVPQAGAGEPVFFPVSGLKLALMSLVTFGLYEVYWFYKNWQCLQRLGHKLNAPIRAVFYPLTAWWLFKPIAEQARKAGLSLQAGGLALAVLIFGGLWRLPEPWWLVSLLGFLPLLPVQQVVNDLNRQVAPDADPNSRFTGANIAALVLGGVLIILTLIGISVPES